MLAPWGDDSPAGTADPAVFCAPRSRLGHHHLDRPVGPRTDYSDPQGAQPRFNVQHAREPRNHHPSGAAESNGRTWSKSAEGAGFRAARRGNLGNRMPAARARRRRGHAQGLAGTGRLLPPALRRCRRLVGKPGPTGAAARSAAGRPVRPNFKQIAPCRSCRGMEGHERSRPFGGATPTGTPERFFSPALSPCRFFASSACCAGPAACCGILKNRMDAACSLFGGTGWRHAQTWWPYRAGASYRPTSPAAWWVQETGRPPIRIGRWA